MIQRQSSVLDQYDRPVPGAEIYVYDSTTNASAVLTSDGVTPLAQPIETDEFGVYSYWADTGVYREEIRYGGKLRYREAGIALGSPSPPTESVATRAALAATTGMVAGNARRLSETGRDGTFQFDSSNLAAQVAADTAQGVYVAPPAPLPLGSAGAWVRTDKTVRPYHFGAVGDGATNDLAALQAFATWVFASPRKQYADFTGTFAISGHLDIGPAATSNNRYPMGGDLKLIQLAATFETLRLKNLLGQTYHGSIYVFGTGAASFASRTCGVGIAFENCGNAQITGMLFAQYFWLAGVHTPTVNNDTLKIGKIRAYNCGSGHADSLTATFSGAANSGSSGDAGQSTLLSGITAFPAAAITTYGPVNQMQIQVRIGGYLYYVSAYDSAAGTITVYPWLDPAVGTSGSLSWVFGGGLCTKTSDANIIEVGNVDILVCGRGIAVGSLYGPRIGSANIASCGTALIIGNGPAEACLGTSIDAFYTEDNTEDIVALARFGGSNYHFVNSSYALDLSKCWATGDPRQTSGGLIAGGGYGEVGQFTGIQIGYRGRLLEFSDRNITQGPLGTAPFVDQRQRPRVLTQFADSQTINLNVVGSGEYNRLFGHKGSNWLYVGTGTNGAPTGSFTFVPPSGGTINGGAVGASVVFTGFNGPALFSISHTDSAQLTWRVRPIAGYNAIAIAPTSVASTGAVSATAELKVTGPTGTARYLKWQTSGVDVAYIALGGSNIDLFFSVPASGSYAFEIGGSAVANLSSAGVLSVTGSYKVGANQVVGARDAGWTADTGTAKKTATATYVVGSALTVGAAYVQAEHTAIITRQALMEAALRDATQEIKALKDLVLAHGLAGA